MEDKEFDLCNKRCKTYLKRNKYGKIQMSFLNEILETVFRQGYLLGLKENEKKNK